MKQRTKLIIALSLAAAALLVMALFGVAVLTAYQMERAVRSGDTATVKRLLDYGVPANAGDPETEWTPLMIAAGEGHEDIALLLLEHGANVNATDNYLGTTALIQAASSGHADIVKLLLDRGADPNVRWKNDGHSALIAAAMRGDVVMAEMLLNKGADPNVSTAGGSTPLSAAKKYKNAALVALLKQAGARQ